MKIARELQTCISGELSTRYPQEFLQTRENHAVIAIFLYIVHNFMHASHHTISVVVSGLGERVAGSTLGELFTQERDELVITFPERGTALMLSCRPDLLLLFLHPSVTRARKNSADVLKEASGKIVTEVTMHSSDRSFTIGLDDGRMLLARLYGPHANVLLLDKTHLVLDAFKHPRELTGSRVDVPPANPAPDATEAVRRCVTYADLPLQAAVKRVLPLLPPVAIRELLHRAEIPSAQRAGDCPPALLQRLQTSLDGITSELRSPTPRLVFSASGILRNFSLIPLSHIAGGEERVFGDMHEALKEYYVRRRSGEAFDAEMHSIREAARRRLERTERTIAAIREDAGEEDRGALYQHYGAILMQHLHDIPRGETAWTVDDGGTAVTIPLVPSLNAVQNAQRYFEKAKSAQRSQALAADRLAIIAGLAERLRSLLTDLDGITTRHDLKAFMKERHDDLDAVGVRGKEGEAERVPFRVFTVAGGFEVWAGKSSRDNDDLTLRHARPDDLWFHARGASGSHVILKVSSARGEPGKRARLEAAAIAAYYSKMRTARLVPVAVTRRKYVHKPRGAPPGTVAISREEVLIVAPGLPQQQQNPLLHNEEQ